MGDHIKVNFDTFYVSKEVYVQDGKAQVRYNISHPSGDELSGTREEMIQLVKDLQVLLSMPEEKEDNL